MVISRWPVRTKHEVDVVLDKVIGYEKNPEFGTWRNLITLVADDEFTRESSSEAFHTQDTDLYSSKRHYEFNAGGSGSDLLRLKSFSERFGFSVDFGSTRCRFIPTDGDRCPGRISACHFITNKSECFSSGGSTFSIEFATNI